MKTNGLLLIIKASHAGISIHSVLLVSLKHPFSASVFVSGRIAYKYTNASLVMFDGDDGKADRHFKRVYNRLWLLISESIWLSSELSRFWHVLSKIWKFVTLPLFCAPFSCATIIERGLLFITKLKMFFTIWSYWCSSVFYDILALLHFRPDGHFISLI